MLELRFVWAAVRSHWRSPAALFALIPAACTAAFARAFAALLPPTASAFLSWASAAANASAKFVLASAFGGARLGLSLGACALAAGGAGALVYFHQV